jgi:hypothetical protein
MKFTFDPPSTYEWTPRGDPIPPEPHPDSVNTGPDLPKIQLALMRALAIFPEARAAVAKALFPFTSFATHPSPQENLCRT